MPKSTLPYHPRRTDGNQAPIMAGLREAGVLVADTHLVGGGFPDAIASKLSDRSLVGLEFKMPGEVLNDRELAFHITWCGYPLFVVYTLEQALEITA